MYELTGWLAISTNPYEEDSQALEVAVSAVRRRLTNSDVLGDAVQLRNMNGVPFLFLGAGHNRRFGLHQQVIELLEFVGREARGSYGIVYWRDDEDPDLPAGPNFHVFVVRRGNVSLQMDPFLSPVVPTIEGE
jgi:Immunity protein 7